MLNICVHCRGIFYGPKAQRIVSEKDGIRTFIQDCLNCGARFEVKVTELTGPVLEGKAFDDVKNIIREEKK